MTDEKLRIKRIIRGRGKKKRNLPVDLMYTGSLLLLALLCFFFLRSDASETFVFGLNRVIGVGNHGSPPTSSPYPSSTMTPTTADTQGQQMISELVWPISGAGEVDIDEDGLFGSYRIHEDKTMHEGIDIDAAKDTSVDAVKEGKIIFAGPQGAYGNLVIVKHADGAKTYYAHLNSYSVVVGDQVQQGQSIGYVGNTAYGKWADPYMEDHLHFEYWVNGKPVDPLPYLLPGQ